MNPENKSMTKLEWTGRLYDYWNRTTCQDTESNIYRASGDFMPLLKEFLPHTWLKSHYNLCPLSASPWRAKWKSCHMSASIYTEIQI
jgi:hypothetical protein